MTAQTLKKVQDLAMQEHRQGRFAEAEVLCLQALEIDPDSFPSLIHLSVLRRHAGRFEEAARLAERAIGINPTAVDGHTQLGLSRLGGGHTMEAAESLFRAIEIDPSIASLHYHLGLAFADLGRTDQARDAFRNAIRLSPKELPPRLNLGALLLLDEDFASALAEAESILKISPRSAEAHVLRARIFFAQGKTAEGDRDLQEALQLNPTLYTAQNLVGFRLLQKGDFGHAEETFRKSLGIDPLQGLPFFGITQSRKLTEEDRPLIDQMSDVLDKRKLGLEEQSYLHFALAKAHDGYENYEKAMAEYDAAHQAAHQARFGSARFDPDAYAERIEHIRKTYDRALLSQEGTCGFDSDLPILITGMMRSGTTLCEQILSCHPQIAAGGEQTFWLTRAQEASEPGGDFHPSHASKLGRQYCNELRKLAPGSRHITDKQPHNYLHLGLLHLALPKAKIIHMRRNPADVGLSAWITANATAPDFTHSKEAIVFVFRQYDELMKHWREILPPQSIYEVRYEELVSQPEPVIRGILEYLELEWDPACLRPDLNPIEVRTPSLWQVRQPFYPEATNRWKRYEPWLGALLELVENPLEP